jgi:nicotinamide-nucleotide amidase
MSDVAGRVAAEIGAAARARGVSVIAAESVTAGSVGQALAAAPEASEWFAGSLVTYMDTTKRTVLGVEVDDVFTPECAEQMAAGALRVSGADAAVAITGVAGPDPQEGHEVGEVYICVGAAESLETFGHRFTGEPVDIVDAAKHQALQHLRDALRGG